MLVDSALADAARRARPQPHHSPIDVDAAPAATQPRVRREPRAFSPPETRQQANATDSPPPPPPSSSSSSLARDRALPVEGSPAANRHELADTSVSNAAFFSSMRETLMPERSPPAKRSLALRAPSALGGGGCATSDAAVAKRVYKSSSDSSADEDADAVEHAAATTTTAPHSTGAGAPAHTKKRLRTSAPLNFFMGAAQAPFAPAADSPRASAPSASPPVALPLALAPVCSSRTRICGQVYGRCELRFSAHSVELVLWRQRPGESEKRAWQGDLPYAHLARFCFYRGASPPYLLLLEIRASEQGQTLFSEFYDSIFAKFAQERVEVPQPNLYGAAFYFDEEVDFVRCTSMSESFSALSELFQHQISESEALEYFDSEVSGSARPAARTTRASFASSLARGVASAASAIFSAGSDQRKPPATESSSTGSKGDKAVAGASQSITKFFSKMPQQPTTQYSSAVVEIDDPSQASLGDDASDETKPLSASSERDTSAGSGAASSALAARKTAVLLTYPYEDAESSSGKISVTYGDIARLAPGEFLNDNIIDFYLRCTSHKDQLYCYSSHFFTQLHGGGAGLSAAERFARVSRWTLKGGDDIFSKQLLFIPINDSFHWSVAVVCNPGSAIVQRRRRLRQLVVSRSGEVSARRPISLDSGEPVIVDLVDPLSQRRAQGDASSSSSSSVADSTTTAPQDDCIEVREEYVEEAIEELEALRRERPPCLLFLDSLKCHRKKKFAAMLREYLESEWTSRHSSSNSHSSSSNGGASPHELTPRSLDDESIVTHFDPDAFQLLEPDIPMQTNSSDCGVFLLMYAAEVARRFPAGVTREDVATQFAATLSADMFDLGHVHEFRDYVHQLLFCLHALQKRGLSEACVKDEELEAFAIDL
ncbi:hypothetical protein PybrP1_007466 [[Pythium] brassicae (nom. inval.)]|nr:hypothetical protein PybrP1_007466 [[Pythium] brassicae (nom. inval.)]